MCVIFVFPEKYFDMNKKQCKDGLECYKRFLVRMDKVGEFLKVAEVWSFIRPQQFSVVQCYDHDSIMSLWVSSENHLVS